MSDLIHTAVGDYTHEEWNYLKHIEKKDEAYLRDKRQMTEEESLQRREENEKVWKIMDIAKHREEKRMVTVRAKRKIMDNWKSLDEKSSLSSIYETIALFEEDIQDSIRSGICMHVDITQKKIMCLRLLIRKKMLRRIDGILFGLFGIGLFSLFSDD